MSTEQARTRAANHARQQATETKLDLLRETLRTMQRDRIPITYPAVARRSGASRTFLYQNTDAKTLMTTAVAASGKQRRQAHADYDAQVQASWQQRALNAEDALTTSYAEIGTQRERIGILLGQIRDLQAEYTEDTVQRVLTENSNLKRRARELADENRSLSERLQAARSNNRFLDKRIADLEAHLLDRDHLST